ncbi:Hypothetical protein, putative [Bodo saltans]|uniref:Uncharacterized protein n=1 Tax=Bodo saltans TaxID=75058 RepID=A0A0S4KN98_BODSA|nr:Hypothetical protein, putative [Bodo saltans]|eukprot:CUI15012.1 Hypothetical protein, putative [Bodo saltans]
MSNVRRLLTKSTSAPPTTTRPRLQLPNHGSTEEQLLAIQQQHERTQQHDDKLKQFNSRVKAQKVESKNERHKSQWLNERNILFEEREKAQCEVDGMWMELDRLFPISASTSGELDDKSDVPIRVAVKTLRMEYQNDRSATMDTSRAVLTSVLGLRARMTTHDALKHAHVEQQLSAKAQKEVQKQQTDLQESLVHLKKCLEEERSDLAQLIQQEVGSSTTVARDGMEKMLSQLKPIIAVGDSELFEGDLFDGSAATGSTRNLDDCEVQAEASIEEIRNRCPHATSDALGLFRGSISSLIEQAKDKMRNSELTMSTRSLSSAASSYIEDEDSRLRIEMLIRSYDPARNRSMFGKTREELFERLVHDLPDVFPNVKAARETVVKLERDRAHRREQRLLIGQLRENVTRLIRCLEEVATAEEGIFIMDAEFSKQQRFDEAAKATRHKELEAMRILHDERMALKDAADAQEREAVKALEDAKKEKLQAEYDARVAELARHHQEKVEAEQRQREANDAIQALANEEKAATALHNQQRVEARRQASAARMDDLRLQKLLADEEVARKKAAFDAFFASVEASTGVARDRDRAMQATVASGQEARSGYVGALEAATLKPTGFMTERLLKDPRFKIHQALVAANLHHTAYARHVIGSSDFHRVAASMIPSAQNTLAHR